MKEKEKILAEIEAKLAEFDSTIEELTQKAEREREKFTPQQHAALEKMKSNRDLAKARLNDLKNADADSWDTLRSKIDKYISDMDDDFRNSLAYAM